jgi:hypothetical protein
MRSDYGFLGELYANSLLYAAAEDSGKSRWRRVTRDLEIIFPRVCQS